MSRVKLWAARLLGRVKLWTARLLLLVIFVVVVWLCLYAYFRGVGPLSR